MHVKVGKVRKVEDQIRGVTNSHPAPRWVTMRSERGGNDMPQDGKGGGFCGQKGRSAAR
jgi:hypothetical protein